MIRLLATLLNLGLGLALTTCGNTFADQLSRDQRRAANEVYLSAGDEPPSMDPTKQADTLSGFWLGHIYEGLLIYDANGNVAPGAAESFKVSEDKKTWTFTIRKNARWHDGKAVSAKDFVFAWQRLVDPAYASEYAFIATVAALANAEDIISKKLPKEKLGVKATDDHTLVVSLTRPVAFFDSLMAFQVFFPVREDVVKKFGDKFAAGQESIVGNGPYKLSAWAKEQSMRIEKADSYWNAAKIKIKAISSPSMVKDTQANYNNFQTGGIDMVSTGTPEVIKQAQDAKHRVQSFPSGCVSYFTLNTRPGKAFANQDLRQAIQIGINRSEFVNKIIGVPGYKPTYGIVPDYLPGSKNGSTYRKEAPLPFKDADLASATKHLDAYRRATGIKQVPPFTILAGDSSRAKKYAEYFQNALSKLLGTTVKIENVPFKVRLQKTRDAQFDMTMAGWCPDYRDAMTFMDLFTSKNENNNTGWANKAYDTLIEKAADEPDLAARVRIFAQAEKLLVSEAPIVSTDQSGGAYVLAPGLTGVRRAVFGTDPDFRNASWARPEASQ